jgi:hypothetical protein
MSVPMDRTVLVTFMAKPVLELNTVLNTIPIDSPHETMQNEHRATIQYISIVRWRFTAVAPKVANIRPDIISNGISSVR